MRNIPGIYFFSGCIDIQFVLEDLIHSIEDGCFLQWEAVVRKEKALPLNKEQQEALDQLISFEDEDDAPILYIDEIPRPSEPWYEIMRKIVPHLLLEKYKTSDIQNEVIGEGWPRLVECLQTFGNGLSLPKGIENVIDVVPVDLQHKLWLQHCFDAVLGGIEIYP